MWYNSVERLCPVITEVSSKDLSTFFAIKKEIFDDLFVKMVLISVKNDFNRRNSRILSEGPTHCNCMHDCCGSLFNFVWIDKILLKFKTFRNAVLVR